ncbi:hypothetical protein HZH66_001290 [Vespula vulgaris]|uniref:Uncharacterized protein n=1 Tax=Vespula vulgaris TaxID=7454 RepID=A0A834KW75_VESVU|nr:hypothetical protein HZH66_001290 [Vespula vulgaris]
MADVIAERFEGELESRRRIFLSDSRLVSPVTSSSYLHRRAPYERPLQQVRVLPWLDISSNISSVSRSPAMPHLGIPYSKSLSLSLSRSYGTSELSKRSKPAMSIDFCLAGTARLSDRRDSQITEFSVDHLRNDADDDDNDEDDDDDDDDEEDDDDEDDSKEHGCNRRKRAGTPSLRKTLR